jgi:GntR family transcriptional regulator
MTASDKPAPQARLPGEREVPQYRRLADLVRGRVADGTYRPGERIPSETAFAKSTGLSFLTVRQALKVLVDEGLLERFPGRGTFVTGLNWRRAPFSLTVEDPGVSGEDFAAELLHTSVERADAAASAALGVETGTPLALMRHCFRLKAGRPFMTEEGRIILDPYRPLLEAELPASFLKGLIHGGAQGLLKSAALTVSPSVLDERDASVLGRPAGAPALALRYVFFDSSSRPVSSGRYLAPEGVLAMTADLGLPLGASPGSLGSGPPSAGARRSDARRPDSPRRPSPSKGTAPGPASGPADASGRDAGRKGPFDA